MCVSEDLQLQSARGTVVIGDRGSRAVILCLELGGAHIKEHFAEMNNGPKISINNRAKHPY